MSSHDPVSEWRERWQSGPPVARPPTPPRPPWVYVLAAFGGTALALLCCIGACIGLGVTSAYRNGGFDTTPKSLTYRNDTSEPVWVFECLERCESDYWDFPMEPGEETSFRLSLYYQDPVEWIVVTREDMTYGCIQITEWKDQTVLISAATACPSDIHSPENDVI
jgi:hypothetical protein